jgi:hypothetical protein
MLRLQKTMLWLAGFSACLVTAWVMAFAMTQQPDDPLLFGGAVVTVGSAAALCVTILLRIESAWRMWPIQVSTSASALSAQFQQRGKVLADRFNIDEPRFCAQAQAVCTAWSFCGSESDKHPAAFATDMDGSRQLITHEALAHDPSLPLIRHRGLPVSCLAQGPIAEASCKPTRTTGR